MKKFFALIMMICMLASVLCVTAFAATAPAAGIVLRIMAERWGEEPTVIGDYDNFQDGWNDAMKIAGDRYKMRENNYTRIVVDLFADWNADKDGEFTDEIWNGPGFDNDTIFIPEGAKVMINMNGHTINRLLTDAKENGEVILIEKKADVIINNGTISGGFSSNSAGGIHINSFATVTLNDVCIFDNETSKAGNGAGIALFDYASLIMNGGSFTENRVQTYGTLFATGGAWANLNNVTVNDNRSASGSSEGVAFAATNRGAILLNDCVVSGNEVGTRSVVYGWNATLVFTNTDFTDNASDNINRANNSTHLFYCSQGGLTVKGGSVTSNHPGNIFCLSESGAIIEGVTITDNTSRLFYVKNYDKPVTMNGCVLNNNKPANGMTTVEVMTKGTLSMNDCDLGDMVLDNKDKIVIAGQTGSDQATASIFGEGSLSMIVSLVALIVSGVSIFLIVDMKKKLVPATAENMEENEE